jgi:LysM repeat protein
MKTINITLVMMLFVLRAFSFNTTDSLGIQKIEGKNYIIHKVSSDETLYSLLKKYDCSSEEVRACNPELKNSSKIFVNQLIKFPTPYSAQQSEAGGSTINEYIVKPGETLYSLSRNLGIPINVLRNLNSLPDNNIRSGQKLFLNEKAKSLAKNDVLSMPAKPLPPVRENVGVIVVPNAPGGEKVKEIGIAQVINTGRKSNKHLALHRTAPVGSLMTITNEATGDHVMVKVIGPLPPTGENENILVRISPSAYNKLQPRDSSLRAEVVYTLPPKGR